MNPDLYALLLYKVQKIESSDTTLDFLNNLLDLYFTVQFTILDEKPKKLELKRKEGE